MRQVFTSLRLCSLQAVFLASFSKSRTIAPALNQKLQTTLHDLDTTLSHSDKLSGDERTSIKDKIEEKMESSRPTGLHLTVTTHALGVASLPGSSVGTTNGVIGAVTLHT
jgi:ElaB/YqjD/DUF883 family membrane-anchored ribosome-binding protein